MWNRVRYLTVLALVSVQLMFAYGLHAQGRKMEGDIETVQVRDNIFMFVMEPAGNVAVSVGEDGVALVDDQFDPMTQRINAAVAELTDKPIRYVFNSHWHGDHTGGNRNFGKQGPVIVAHDNVRQRMSAEQFHLFFKARSPASPPEALPVITFNDTMTFYFNGDVIDVVHMPNAHTDGDAVFHFRNADVIHAGDVFINRGYPLIDIASGGTIMGQIAATNRILEMMGPDTIVIPGHGPLADKGRVMAIRDMLIKAWTNVADLIIEGKSLEEIIAAEPLAELDPEWGQGFVRAKTFIQIIYQSETGAWEKPENMPLVR
jgi:cyclase